LLIWLGLTPLGALAGPPTGAIVLDGTIGDSSGPVAVDEATSTYHLTSDLGEFADPANPESPLFFSFGRFNVPEGGIAEFSAAADRFPNYVMARVTWGEPSLIEGVIRSTIHGADFFLLNPAGITMGPRGSAQIDGGSFYVSTADRVSFQRGGVDFHVDPMQPLVLSVEDPAAFGFLASGGGTIDFEIRAQGSLLSVDPGETFGVVAGDIQIVGNGTTFESTGSEVALVAAGPGVEVPVDLSSFDPGSIDPSIPLGAIRISGAEIAVANPQAGTVVVRGGSLEMENGALLDVHDAVNDSAFSRGIDVHVRDGLSLTDVIVNAGTRSSGAGGDVWLVGGEIAIRNSEILVATAGDGPGADLIVRADGLYVADDALLSTKSFSRGPGGAIDVEVDNLRLETGGRIGSEAISTGPAGDVRIVADDVSVSDAGSSMSGTFISSDTLSQSPMATAANGGNVTVEADTLSLTDGGQIFSRSTGRSPGGSLTVTADSVSLEGRSGSRPSAISTATQFQGDGGALTITADSVVVSDGAEIQSSTEGLGNAGSIAILATGGSVLIEGGPQGASVVNASAIPATPTGDTGRPGSIEVRAASLEIRAGGAITGSTGANEDGATVQIEVDELTLTGSGPTDTQTGIFSQSVAPAPRGGAGGLLSIDVAGDLRMREGARIAALTRGAGTGGTIDVDARGRIDLSGGSSIRVLATGEATGASGSISIVAGEGVALSGGSSITAEALGQGDAGTIVVDAGPELQLDASTITTQAREGGGGQITITASDEVRLTDSSIDTSVATGRGDGGDVRIDPDLVVLNRSQILANAEDGNGGSIFIRAGAFILSTGSVVDASSQTGIDGSVSIESPASDLTSQTTPPPQQYLDVSALLGNACAAAGASQSSLVVNRVAGLPATPEGPLPSRLWDESWLTPGRSTGDALVALRTAVTAPIVGALQ